MDFTGITIGQAYGIVLMFNKDNDTAIETVAVSVGAAATRAQVLQTIVDALTDTPFKATIDGNVLTITTPAKTEFRKFDLEAAKQDGTHMTGPTFLTAVGISRVTVNGTRVDGPR